VNRIERLEKRWLADRDLQELSPDHTRAIIDALALAVYADLNVDEQEEEAFDSLVLSLPCGWSEVEDLDIHASKAVKAAATIGSVEGLRARANEIAATIPEHVRDQVFSMLIAVAVADLEMHEHEVTALTVFGEAFGFDQAKADMIYADTIEGLGLVEGD